jgi:argininosuccinate lyase
MVCDLPIAPGRVVDISSEAELAALPDVVEVDLFTRPGDVIDEDLNSASRTGSVYLALPHPGLLAPRLAAVERAYRLTTTAAAPAAPAPGCVRAGRSPSSGS